MLKMPHRYIQEYRQLITVARKFYYITPELLTQFDISSLYIVIDCTHSIDSTHNEPTVKVNNKAKTFNIY